MSVFLPIETDRLTLRRYLETDYDDLLKLQSNDDVTRFLLYESKTPEQVRERSGWPTYRWTPTVKR